MWRMSLTVMFRATGSTRAPGADAHRRLTLPCRGSTGLRGHHPTGAFRTSFAKLKIKAGSPPGFDLNEFFTLARNSNGINPVTENVTLKIGAFSVTIPPDSFKQILPRRFEFQGTIKRRELAGSNRAPRQQHFDIQGGGHRRGFDPGH